MNTIPSNPETYFVWDLARNAPGKPGEVVRIRVRAREENYARFGAAAYRGTEADSEWLDASKSTATRVCEAAVQWAGVVRVLGFEHASEKARVTQARHAPRPVAPPEVDLDDARLDEVVESGEDDADRDEESDESEEDDHLVSDESVDDEDGGWAASAILHETET